MYRVREAKRTVVGALEHQADLLELIARVAGETGIEFGHFQLFGAVYQATVAVWNTETKIYEETAIDHFCEISAGMGTISRRQGEINLHCHLTLVDKQGRVYGGHLMPGSRLFAGEYWITELEGPALERQYEEERGLWLWADER